RVPDFGFIVRHTFVEALVECQEMTCRAGVGELYRCHQFAAADRPGRLETFRGSGEEFVIVLVARSGAILRTGISQVGSGRGTMAITAFQIHQSAVRPADWFHMNRMI